MNKIIAYIIANIQAPEMVFHRDVFTSRSPYHKIPNQSKMKIMLLNEEKHSTRNLWTMRSYYFLWLGGLGFFWPFFNLFCARQGLNGTQIGWIASIAALMALIFSPIWTDIAAKSGKGRLILQVSLVATAAFAILLGQQRTFLWILAINAIRIIAFAGISPLSDSLAVSVTESNRSGFGSVRVWASVGWCPIVLIAGWLIQRFGIFTSFIGTAVTMVLAAVSLIFVNHNWLDRKRDKSETSHSLFSVIKMLLHNREALGYGLLLIAIGIGNCGVVQFEILYMDRLGASVFILGVAAMIGAVVELPCMPWTDRLLRGKTTARQLLLISMLSYVILRLMVYFFPSVTMIIITRVLGGVSFSFYTIAGIRYMSDLLPTPVRGTVLALYTVTLVNIINIFATPITGIAYDLFGAPWMYVIAAIGYLIGWLCLYVAKEPAVKPLVAESAD
jgi:MFS transporter, PPP family, 3-phenylpropionic acid transporter